MPGTLWTVGHSTRSLQELVALLRSNGIESLVDVRTVPRSRHNPQFNVDALALGLEPAGIAHRHEPRLGGLRKPAPDSVNTAWRNAGFRGYADHMQSDTFAEALSGLLEETTARPTTVMCAEAVPWRCHRSLIADAAVVQGFEVRHIMAPGKANPHKLTPFAKVDGSKITYPGLV